MAKSILLDEFHLTIRARHGLRETGYAAMRQTLDDPRFQAALRGAIRGIFRRYPSLAKARARLSR